MKKLFNLKFSYYACGYIILLVIAIGILYLITNKMWTISYAWVFPLPFLAILLLIASTVADTNEKEKYFDSLTCLELKKKLSTDNRLGNSRWIFLNLSYFSIYDFDDEFLVDKKNSLSANYYRKKIFAAKYSNKYLKFNKQIVPYHVLEEFSLRVLSTDKYDQMTITQLQEQYDEL